MKRTVVSLLAVSLCVMLAACGAVVPEQAADGAPWSEDWVTVGGVLGVDTPEGMTPRENNEALAANGMYYATWSMGEAVPYQNEDGEEAQLYDAQVYLLLSGHLSAESAAETLDEWLELVDTRYHVASTDARTFNGQEFTVYTYTFDSETNPYAWGASAFGTFDAFAVSVEISCQEDFEGDALELLSGFLERCHYGAA